MSSPNLELNPRSTVAFTSESDVRVPAHFWYVCAAPCTARISARITSVQVVGYTLVPDLSNQGVGATSGLGETKAAPCRAVPGRILQCRPRASGDMHAHRIPRRRDRSIACQKSRGRPTGEAVLLDVGRFLDGHSGR
jgi:hypothetical protein